MHGSSGFAISGELPEFPFCAVFAIKQAPKVAGSSLVTTVIPPQNLTTQQESSSHGSPPPSPPDDALTEKFYSFKDSPSSSSSPEFYSFKNNVPLSSSHSSASETLAQIDENLKGSEICQEHDEESLSDENTVNLAATQPQDTLSVTGNGLNKQDHIHVAENNLDKQDQSSLPVPDEATNFCTTKKIKTKKKKKKKKFPALERMGNRLCAPMRAIGICLSRCSPCAMAFGDDQASLNSICAGSDDYSPQFIRQVIENNSLFVQAPFN